jgi:predicted dehydrogenase
VRASAFGGAPPWEGYASDPSPFFSAEGGPLVDMAVYPLAAIAGLIAPVARVSAMSSRTRDAFEVAEGPAAGLRVPVEAADNWHLALELQDGCLAAVEANFCAHATAAPELEIRGDVGTLALSLLDVSQPVRLFAGGEWHETGVPHARSAGPDHLLGVEQLVESVLYGGEPSLSADRAIHVLAVIAGARLAAAGGHAVEISHEEAPE